MKRFSILMLTAAAFILNSCYFARIVTVSSGPEEVVHTTTVSYPNSNMSTNIYASDYDLCLHLDLQAVATAFAQASTIRNFEMLLNNSSYMISNLDLNGDGYIDYLRVVERMDRFTHAFVIQAVLGMNVYQDVATIVVERPSMSDYYVEIIGAPFIYGHNYIIRPVYRTRPGIYAHIYAYNYSPWISPWYWNHYPSCFKRPRPHYLSHYQAYVNTYLHNHHCCHAIHYPDHHHYKDYDRFTRALQRHDYADKHPERSFTERTAKIAGSDSAVRRAQNARDIYNAQQASSKVTTSTNSRTPASSASSSNRVSSSTTGRGSVTSSSSSNKTSGSRTSSSSVNSGNRTANTSSSVSSGNRTSGSSVSSGNRTSSSSVSSGNRTSGSSSTVSSRVSRSGSTRTTTTTSPSRSSSSSSSVRSSSSSSSVRSSSSSSARSSSSSSVRSSSSSASRSSSSSSSSRSSSSSSRTSSSGARR